MEHALGELQISRRDLNSMFILNCVVGDRPIYEDLRGKIETVVAEIDLVQFFKTSPDECGQFILFASQLAASSTETTQTNKVWQECLLLASHLATTNPIIGKTRTLNEHLTLSLTDAALRLSSSPDGRQAGLQMFVAKLTDVAKRWPGFAKHYGSPLMQALNRLPADDLTGLPNCW